MYRVSVNGCRVIVCDGQGAAWVGSDSGNVKRIELHRKQTTDGNTKLWLEHTHTLRHPAKSRRSSIVFSSTASAELDDLSRADSAHASEDDSATEDPGPGTAGVRAHSGPVTAVETYRNFVFTSGGTHSSCALHQWTQNGMLHHSHKLKELGKPHITHVRLRVLISLTTPFAGPWSTAVSHLYALSDTQNRWVLLAALIHASVPAEMESSIKTPDVVTQQVWLGQSGH